MARRKNTGRNQKNIRGKKKVRNDQRQKTFQRVSLEKKWYSSIDFTPEMVGLATHESSSHEPLHRWLPYRQGFAPELVREFLKNAEVENGVILDPFSGSGTTVIECSRENIPAVGIEALGSIAFLSSVRLNNKNVELVSFPEGEKDAEIVYSTADTALHRAAVLMAQSRTVKGDGSPRKNCEPFEQLLSECTGLINEDLKHLPDPCGKIIQGDARMIPLADNSVGGILTSPPYLSRYDYTKVVRPVEQLYYGTNYNKEGRSVQLRAHHKAYFRKWKGRPNPAVVEVCDRLNESGKKREAGAVRSYFEDMEMVLAESMRVLQVGAPLVMVVAGALFAKEYVPSDIIIAEICSEMGFEIEEILRLREFGMGKRLGDLDNIAPREVILSVRKV
jgi:hypothetical protein